MFINKCMCYGLNIARNWIAWTLYSETTTFCFLLFWISGLSGGFIGEFLQFCCCLFSCWWSDKDTDCICCVYCILKWFTSLEPQESQLSMDIWHAQLFVFWVFVSDDFTPTPLGVPPAGRWVRNRFYQNFLFQRILLMFKNMSYKLHHPRKHPHAELSPAIEKLLQLIMIYFKGISVSQCVLLQISPHLW